MSTRNHGERGDDRRPLTEAQVVEALRRGAITKDGARASLLSLPRRYDDHSASRRVDVLLEEAPHLLADEHRRDLWNLRAVLALALAVLAFAVGYALGAFYMHAAATVAYYVGFVLVIAAAVARAKANAERRR